MTANADTDGCPLCRYRNVSPFCRDAFRDYYRCGVCGLVFVPSAQHLSEGEEKARYDLHENSPSHAGYRSFLNRLFVPLEQRLTPGSSGLDFGSGPSPVLSLLFTAAGHSMALFDRFYEPVPARLACRYDFITATEVVEHLREPRQELDRLWDCLKEGGWLGIMTRAAVDQESFSSWHYKNDRTHICFFSPETFAWLARHWTAELSFVDNDVVLFRKLRA